ncbi:MAG: HAMP domain-containing histidine kinase [Lachnospiraceae bacterium]|nr:HAMP domain-containing histidine kinase [Lachnospiraceae bacterium]
MEYLWIAAIILLVILILVECIRILLFKKSVRRIADDFQKRLHTDTNTKIDVPAKDKDLVYLITGLNEGLGDLRKEHLNYYQGDRELKNAVTNISHDLRTPLTAIVGYLDLMETTEDPEKQKMYLKILRERTDMMRQLTEELFKYSVIVSDEDPELENVYVNRILEEAISAYYVNLAEKGIEPDIQMTGKRIERLGNDRALARVFSNLLQNVIRYSDGDLRIVLEDSGEITFSNTAKKLSTVEVEQLFDRFYTVEVGRGSTGLGLSIARTLVERMGGSITADFAPETSRLTMRIILLPAKDH